MIVQSTPLPLLDAARPSGLPTRRRRVADVAPSAAGTAPLRREPVPPQRLRAADRPANTTAHRQLNDQISGAQQALTFLGRVTRQLEQLKAAISSSLASGTPARPLDARVTALQALIRERHAATNGRLNDALEIGAAGSARRDFELPGLRGGEPQPIAPETLTFYVKGASAQPVTVYLDANLSAKELAERLQAALLPANITVRHDERQRIVFSALETQWARLEEGVVAKGGGIRLPGGQPTRIVPEPLPGVIDPSQWHGADRDALRATLQRVVAALGQVHDAAEKAQTSLQQTRQFVNDGGRTLDAHWALRASTTISDALRPSQSFYDAVTLSAAVMGIDAGRVRALLALHS